MWKATDMAMEPTDLASTIKAMRPVVPARNFEISTCFYVDLGFRPHVLIADRLVEMHLGAFSFMLQNYYVQQWADNFVIHMRVSDVKLWWDHIVALDLQTRYGAKTVAPQDEGWGMVIGVIDPSGVLWRIAESPPRN
jgi:hypothetical protein